VTPEFASLIALVIVVGLLGESLVELLREVWFDGESTTLERDGGSGDDGSRD
jgi:hypothetical protein